MKNKDNDSGRRDCYDGYVPLKKGYQPGGTVTGGHKPEKSELIPVNPPKKK